MKKDFKRILGNELLSGLPRHINSTRELAECVNLAMQEIEQLITIHQARIEEAYTPHPQVEAKHILGKTNKPRHINKP